MKIERAIKSLKEKQAIILRTDNDHWLYEPITTVLEELERLRNENEKLQNRVEDLYDMFLGEDD